MTFTQSKLIKYLDVRIKKAQSFIGGSTNHCGIEQAEMEVKLLTDLRDGLRAITIPNSRGLTHREQVAYTTGNK